MRLRPSEADVSLESSLTVGNGNGIIPPLSLIYCPLSTAGLPIPGHLSFSFITIVYSSLFASYLTSSIPLCSALRPLQPFLINSMQFFIS